MMYTIKAIPTTYSGVNFRSRLEARWAAFFDLAGIKWEYEPFDLEGWTPDFLLPKLEVLVEVKPLYMDSELPDEALEALVKVVDHARRHDVLLLGLRPISDQSIGVSLERCEPLPVNMAQKMWRSAGNVVQWTVDRNQETPMQAIRRIIRKAK